jgi:hypothetical protein
LPLRASREARRRWPLANAAGGETQILARRARRSTGRSAVCRPDRQASPSIPIDLGRRVVVPVDGPDAAGRCAATCAAEEDGAVDGFPTTDDPLADLATDDEATTDDDLPAAERARMRRRDHDLAAHDRALMNDGSAKWFKQALDRQAREARSDRARRPER